MHRIIRNKQFAVEIEKILALGEVLKEKNIGSLSESCQFSITKRGSLYDSSAENGHPNSSTYAAHPK